MTSLKNLTIHLHPTRQSLILFFTIFFFSFVLSSGLSARQVAAILRAPITAKANALGAAYSGSVKDPSALLWNPAGLAHISGQNKLMRKKDKVKKAEDAFERFARGGKNDDDSEYSKDENEDNLANEYQRTFEFQVLSTLTQLSLDRRIGFVGVGFPIFAGSLGLGILASQVTNIDGYDQVGASIGELEYNLYSIYAGYALEVGHARMGITLNGIFENLAGKSIVGGSVDIGIQFFASIFELGASLQSLGGFIQKSISEPNSLERLDIILRVSVGAVIPRTGIRLYLGLTSNLDNYETSPPLLNVGFSYDLFRYVSISLGLNGGRPSVGLELKFPYIGFSYALNQDKLSYDIQHFIDVHLKF